MYDTIICMKAKTLYIVKYLILLGVILACSIGATLFARNSAVAFAEETTKVFLPQTKLENTELSSPVDVFCGNEIIILQNNEILISRNGEFVKSSGYTALKQVKDFNAESFLISDDGSVYSVSKTDFTTTPLVFDSKNVGGNNFDISENYLITAYSSQAHVYTLESGVITSKHAPFEANANKPICINDLAQIFYVNNDKLFMKNADALSNEAVLLAEISPDKMIASDTYIYTIANNKIYRITIADGNVVELTNASANTEYDLGNIISPSSICFKGENLFITDTYVNAVQEFSISEQTLTFTGYAIAKNKTAYNRISANASIIERYGDKIASLDQNKLTVINVGANFNGKSAESFINVPASDLGALTSFVLGDGKALICYNQSVKLLDLASKNLSAEIALSSGNFKDAFYYNKTFYVATADGTNSYVYTINQAQMSAIVFKTYDDVRVEKICFTETNDIYLVDNNENIYKNGVASENLIVQNSAHVNDIYSDLSGKIYILDDTKTLKYINGTNIETTACSGVKALTMSFDKKDVFFLKENDEFIYSTTGLNNFSIETTPVPQTYVLTGANADSQSLKIYTVLDAPLYSVTAGENTFAYKGLAEKETEYVYICDVTVVGEVKLVALAGQNGIVLTHLNFASEVAVTTSPAPQKTFVTTGVHAYYLPIITFDREYVLRDSDLIKLNKGAEITPETTVTVLGRSYYFAKVTFNGNEYYGYVPKEFTVDVLAEDKELTSFELAKLNPTIVYADADLQTALAELTEVTEVRLIKTENGVAEIYFLSSGSYIKGYVNAEAVTKAPKTAVRNAIIIFITVTCVCSSAIYFIVKKKDN